MQGIGRGFQQATDTLLQVSLKKRQLEKEDKEFSIGMKMKKLQLEALEEKMSPEQLGYNKTLQGLEMKSHKLKTENATLDLNKARTEAQLSQFATEKFIQGIEQGEVDGLRQGFELGGAMYDLNIPISGFKKRTFTQKERFNKDIQKARQGKISWEELENIYPAEGEKIDELKYRSEVSEEDETLSKVEEKLIEPRAEGLGRIGRGAKYGEAIEAYGEETTDRIIGAIQDYQKEGKTFGEISKLMQEQNINPELFLKFYR